MSPVRRRSARLLVLVVLGFALALTRGTTILVGLAPALLATRPAVWPALTSSVAAEGRSGLHLRRLLVTGQIKERGVMMPESMDPEPLMDNFTKEGLQIFVEKREVERM